MTELRKNACSSPVVGIRVEEVDHNGETDRFGKNFTSVTYFKTRGPVGRTVQTTTFRGDHPGVPLHEFVIRKSQSVQRDGVLTSERRLTRGQLVRQEVEEKGETSLRPTELRVKRGENLQKQLPPFFMSKGRVNLLFGFRKVRFSGKV